MPKPRAQMLHKVCEKCGEPFETPDKKNYREKVFCSRACSNVATAEKRAEAIRANKKYKPPICPCGKEVPPPIWSAVHLPAPEEALLPRVSEDVRQEEAGQPRELHHLQLSELRQ